MADEVQFKSFSKARPKIEFDAGPDEERFEAYPVMPPTMLQELLAVIRQVRTVGGVDEEKAVKTFTMLSDFFKLVLVDESYSRFQNKMSDRISGVQIDECTEIFQWLVERYGLRPSESSTSSSAGSPSGVDGTSSTAGAPLEESDPSS